MAPPRKAAARRKVGTLSKGPGRGPDTPAAHGFELPEHQGRGESTHAVHAGEVPDARTGAINVPIHLSSTFWYPELPDGTQAPYIYTRYTNPNFEVVETKLAALEQAAGALVFSSGMAATMTACVAFLQTGSTVAVQSGVYGGTSSFMADELTRFGVGTTFVDHVEPPTLRKGTSLVWMESITNPLLRVADVKAWADAAHDAGARLAVDATFASPMLQKPLLMGADIAMHSGTKYLGGHADLIAGALSWKDPTLRDPLWRVRRSWGPSLDPHAAYLLSRGMKTLPLRMQRHCENGLAVAKAAEAMKGIAAVHYPGLTSHPDHATAKRVLKGFGGMVTIDLGSLKRAEAFRRKVRIITPAASIGGVESLCCLPVETSHAYATPAKQKADGVTPGLVRISIGVEDADDIIADIEQAARP
jgi:cystathionine beta-lyase/cystathionine gamma-synthase